MDAKDSGSTRHTDPASPRLGILGGMGPLASTELVYTIYRLNMAEPEQQAPACVLLSDPSIPDRTTAILAGDTGEVARRLAQALGELERMGAERIVIACVTAHAVLDEVPARLREKVVSLLDLVMDELGRSGKPHLLLATNGTRRAQIFERHPRWREVEGLARFLGEEDQHRLHGMLYRFKQNEPLEPALPWLASLPESYEVHGLIFGCTELHLFQRLLARQTDGARKLAVIDPLLIAAREVPRQLGYRGSEAPVAAGDGS
jgi:aspartate racemase